ncbi:MAG: PIN domain-containing protein [Planctomycetota bacterium]|nr:PIN domain-containing protein [Planctomycetota bacterium]
MKTVFVDTLFYLALANGDDEYHDVAGEFERSFRGRLITTEYVLVEVLDALTGGDLRELGLAIVEAAIEDDATAVIPAGTELFGRARELFRQRADKQWGITDCISFVVMQEQGVREALTADHHFEQAGFRALLRGASAQGE